MQRMLTAGAALVFALALTACGGSSAGDDELDASGPVDHGNGGSSETGGGGEFPISQAMCDSMVPTITEYASSTYREQLRLSGADIDLSDGAEVVVATSFVPHASQCQFDSDVHRDGVKVGEASGFLHIGVQPSETDAYENPDFANLFDAPGWRAGLDIGVNNELVLRAPEGWSYDNTLICSVRWKDDPNQAGTVQICDAAWSVIR